LHYSISPLNETALLVSFENSIDEGINDRVMGLQRSIQQQPFKGLIETVPAYSSLAIFYNLAEVYNGYHLQTTAFDFLKQYTEQLLIEGRSFPAAENKRVIQIPVYYNGVDLLSVARLHQLPVEEVIRIHTEKRVRVFMIGFLPGFAYMGKVTSESRRQGLLYPGAM
jgi:inhibitor of KinA